MFGCNSVYIEIIAIFVILSLYSLHQPTTPEEIPEMLFYEPPYILDYEEVQEIVPQIWWNKIAFQCYKIPHEIVCGNLVCDVGPYTQVTSPKDDIAAYVFHPHKMSPQDYPLLPTNPAIKLWGTLLEETPLYCIECMHLKVLQLFNYSSTFSRYSDVPFTLRYVLSLNNITSKVNFVETAKKNALIKNDGISPILYLQTHCLTMTERDLYVQEFMKYQHIDSYGDCINNKDLKLSLKKDYIFKLDDPNQLTFISKYKFIIAFENFVCEDYVTEKLWRAIHIGVVPIYFGSPSIKDWLPNPKSAILLQDFPTPKLLSDHIDLLLKNDDMYEEYLEHKTKGIITNKNLISELNIRQYQSKGIDAIMNEFSCFLCKKLHEIKEGNELPYRVIGRNHFDCPLSISALTQTMKQHTKYSNYVMNIYNQTAKVYDSR